MRTRVPTFATGSEDVDRAVAENTPAGQPLGAPISATDGDGDTLTYALAGTDAASFALDADSGQVRTKAVLDYESRTAYAVIVEVSDGQGGTASQPVTIAVTDEDEPPDAPDAPTVTGTSSMSLAGGLDGPGDGGTAGGERLRCAVSARRQRRGVCRRGLRWHGDDDRAGWVATGHGV